MKFHSIHGLFLGGNILIIYYIIYNIIYRNKKINFYTKKSNKSMLIIGCISCFMYFFPHIYVYKLFNNYNYYVLFNCVIFVIMYLYLFITLFKSLKNFNSAIHTIEKLSNNKVYINNIHK